MTKQIIVKIQRSLFSSVGGDTMLIYNKTRSFNTVLPLSKEIKKLLGEAPKGYFLVEVDPSGIIKIEKQVPEQNW